MNFFYEATDTTGQTVMGRLDAGSETEVRQRLQQMGYRPHAIALNGAPPAPQQSLANAPVHHATAVMPAGMGSRQAAVQPQVSTTGARTGGIILSGNAARTTVAQSQTVGTTSLGRATPAANVSQLGGVNDRDRLFFFQQLTSLVKSGMSIYLALDNLGPRTKNANLSQAARDMAEGARTGGRVSDVMERYPRIFEEHITGLIRAGELGGFLPEALAEISLNYEQNLALYKGSWIPKLMAVQAIYALALAIPLFGDILNPIGLEKGFGPGFQLYLIHEAIILPITSLIVVGVKYGWSRAQLPQLRQFRDEMALRTPPFGDLHRQAALAAFIRMLSKLYQAGVGPAAAWHGAMQTASNVVIRDRLASSYTMMQTGVSLADAFTATKLFQGNMEQLLITGQVSGHVAESLDQIADFYHERVDEARKKAQFGLLRIGIICMLVLGGATFLWLVHTYFGAIFKLGDSMNPDIIVHRYGRFWGQ